jgi:hypothetical protein
MTCTESLLIRAVKAFLVNGRGEALTDVPSTPHHRGRNLRAISCWHRTAILLRLEKGLRITTNPSPTVQNESRAIAYML